MSEAKNTNESRRGFLKSSSFAAAGLVLTPILVNCGGEEEGKSTPRGAAKPKPQNKGSGNTGGTTKPAPRSAANVVDNVADLGKTGTVALSALLDSAKAPKHFAKTDMNTDEPKAAEATGGKYPVDESVVFTNATAVEGKYAVPNVVFELSPKDGQKMLAYKENAVGENYQFRITRAFVVGAGKDVTVNIYDEVNHNITVKSGPNEFANKSENGTPAGVPITAKGLFAGIYGVTCSMHAWEKAYVYCLPHAYFGVTGCELDQKGVKDHGKERSNDGKVTIENVAVGKYDVLVWMDGKKVGDPVEITVEEGKTVSKNFASF